jgi:hypothetical protein
MEVSPGFSDYRAKQERNKGRPCAAGVVFMPAILWPVQTRNNRIFGII